jgi:predicted RNA-binding Zn ribbon-like protein
VHLDRYADAGIPTAVQLVNTLARRDRGAEAPPTDRVLPSLRKILALDPPSVAMLREKDAPGFLALARALRRIFDDLDRRDLDSAAGRLNELLARHPAHPHLAKEQGRWRMHHHPADVALVPMWSSVCAEAMARMVGAGHGERFGSCEAPACGRVFFDVSRNGSRRFCSTTCQNRVKAAAFRRRRTGAAPTGPSPRARRPARPGR